MSCDITHIVVNLSSQNFCKYEFHSQYLPLGLSEINLGPELGRTETIRIVVWYFFISFFHNIYTEVLLTYVRNIMHFTKFQERQQADCADVRAALKFSSFPPVSVVLFQVGNSDFPSVGTQH